MDLRDDILSIGPTGLDVSIDLERMRAQGPATAVRFGLGGACRNCAVDLARLGAKVTFLTQRHGDIAVREPKLPDGVQEVRLPGETDSRDWLALFTAVVDGPDVLLAAAAYEEAALIFTRAAAEREELRIRSFRTVVTSSDVSRGFWDVVRGGSDAARLTKCLLTSGLPLPLNYMQWLNSCDLFFINADEVNQLGFEPETFCREVIARGTRNVFVTVGQEGGAWYADENHSPQFRGARELTQPVVSSVGAGDGFAAGVIRGFTLGLDIASSVDLGLATAALILFEPANTLSRSIDVTHLLGDTAYSEGVEQ